jgi:WD40 repeat protein
MDLFEAIGLLGLEPHIIDADCTDYTSKDVEKCFRQQALRHHPDKGGDASHFQLLHQAKNMLLELNAGNTMGTTGSASCRASDANSTAVSTSLYEHRTCVRQVLVIHGKRKTVIAATDDGLTVIELKKDANYYTSGGLERVVSFTTHRDDCSFLCCTTAVPSSNDNDDYDDSFVVDVLYAGAKDGFIHKIELSTRRLTPWQLPSRERIVAISAIRDLVAIATAEGGIYVFEYQNGSSTPTMVWKCPVAAGKGTTRGKKKTCGAMTPETIFLEEGFKSDCLNLWVGGSSSDTVTGRLVMWELDVQEDLFERYNDDNDIEDLCGEYGIYESDTDSNSEEPEDCACDDERNILAIDVTVHEGPIFSLSKHKRTVAVTVGQCIVVWDYNDNNKPGKKLTKIKTIQTNNQTLYTLCMNERFVAAAGSGESIMVWDRDLWTMLHHLPLQRAPSGCCLATNCIMTLDWFHDDSGILVSGGYDGVVTMWTLANRISNDDTSSRGM